MESTPQSTINHNAVIELASDLVRMSPAPRPRKPTGAQKSGPPCPKGGPEIGGDHAQNASRAQRRGLQKRSISKGICAAGGYFHQNPRNGYRTCALAPVPHPLRPEISERLCPRQWSRSG